MAIRQFWFSLALLTAACVLGLFFCPLPHGSFVATHGPVTSLRLLPIAFIFLTALALAGAQSGAFADGPHRALAVATSRVRGRAHPAPPSSISCLRC